MEAVPFFLAPDSLCPSPSSPLFSLDLRLLSAGTSELTPEGQGLNMLFPWGHEIVVLTQAAKLAEEPDSPSPEVATPW